MTALLIRDCATLSYPSTVSHLLSAFHLNFENYFSPFCVFPLGILCVIICEKKFKKEKSLLDKITVMIILELGLYWCLRSYNKKNMRLPTSLTSDGAVISALAPRGSWDWVQTEDSLIGFVYSPRECLVFLFSSKLKILVSIKNCRASKGNPSHQHFIILFLIFVIKHLNVSNSWNQLSWFDEGYADILTNCKISFRPF